MIDDGLLEQQRLLERVVRRAVEKDAAVRPEPIAVVGGGTTLGMSNTVVTPPAAAVMVPW